MRIKGKCHCGNIGYVLDWPDDEGEIAVRACGCSFCTKHGGLWTSHPNANLTADVSEASLLSKYSFATQTADFYVCARCGAVPFVSSTIDGQVYAVVNANAFDGRDSLPLIRSTTNFDGESTAERLARRKRNWIQSVRISC